MTVEERLEHAQEALNAILVRCDGIARPNGTTNVIARIAAAGINGGSIADAGRRQRR